jgi:uncharacterized SAM-binding protein YcdF (DUF218 family)
MFLIGKLGWAVLQPGNLLVLLLIAGFLLLLSSQGRWGKALIGLATLGFTVLAVVPLGPALLLELEHRFPRPAALPARIDGILALGGAVDPRLSLAYGETAFNGSVTRVLAATALARRHPEAKLVLVGGEGDFFPTGYPEARATLGFVLDEGIARDRVILEPRSRSTHENAVFARALDSPKTRRELGIDYVSVPYAARRRVVPRGRLASDPLSGRLQGRSNGRPAPKFQFARRAQRLHDRRQGVARPGGVSAVRMDAGTVSRGSRRRHDRVKSLSNLANCAYAENTVQTTARVIPLQ